MFTIPYTLNNYVEGAVNITYDENLNLFINSPYDAEYLVMASMSQGFLKAGSTEPLSLRSRYIINDQSIVFPKTVIKGKFDVVKKSELLKSDQDGIELLISTTNDSKKIRVIGGKGTNNPFKSFKIGGKSFLLGMVQKYLIYHFQ